MDDRNAQVGWTEAQWNRVREEVLQAWQRVRVAGSFLPIYGPLPPSTTVVPSEVLKPDGSVDDRATADLLEIALPVTLSRQQILEQDLSSALLQFRRRATQLGQLEDWFIFNGTYPSIEFSAGALAEFAKERKTGLPDYRPALPYLDQLTPSEWAPMRGTPRPIADVNQSLQKEGRRQRNPGSLGLIGAPRVELEDKSAKRTTRAEQAQQQAKRAQWQADDARQQAAAARQRANAAQQRAAVAQQQAAAAQQQSAVAQQQAAAAQQRAAAAQQQADAARQQAADAQARADVARQRPAAARQEAADAQARADVAGQEAADAQAQAADAGQQAADAGQRAAAAGQRAAAAQQQADDAGQRADDARQQAADAQQQAADAQQQAADAQQRAADALKVLNEISPLNNDGLTQAIVDAINSLEENGYVAPYVCVFGRNPFQAAFIPINNSTVLPRDRIEPLIGRQLLHASGIDVLPQRVDLYPRLDRAGWPSRGVLLSMADEPIDLALAVEATPEFRQVDLEGRYVFSVFERFALRIKDAKAIVPLQFEP